MRSIKEIGRQLIFISYRLFSLIIMIAVELIILRIYANYLIVSVKPAAFANDRSNRSSTVMESF